MKITKEQKCKWLWEQRDTLFLKIDALEKDIRVIASYRKSKTYDKREEWNVRRELKKLCVALAVTKDLYNLYYPNHK